MSIVGIVVVVGEVIVLVVGGSAWDRLRVGDTK